MELRYAALSDQDVVDIMLQEYLREMSDYYGDTSDENGRFPYPWLPLYFTERDRHIIWFEEEGQAVGFAFVNTHAFTEEPIDHAIAEFEIFPWCRRKGYARQAVDALFAAMPGVWQFKYSPANTAGAVLWKKVTEQYHGKEYPLEENEIAVVLKAD